MSLYDITIEVAPFLLLCVISISIYYKSYHHVVLKPLIYYIFIAFVIECLSRLLTTYGKHNIFLLNIFVFIQFTCFSIYFIKIFDRSNIKCIIKYTMYLVVGCLLFQYIVNIDFFIKYNPLGYLITMLPVIFYSVCAVFMSVLEKKLNKYLLINFGVIMYVSSSLLVFLSSNLLLDLKLYQFDYIYVLNNLMYIVFLTLILINIWKLTNLKQMRF